MFKNEDLKNVKTQENKLIKFLNLSYSISKSNNSNNSNNIINDSINFNPLTESKSFISLNLTSKSNNKSKMAQNPNYIKNQEIVKKEQLDSYINSNSYILTNFEKQEIYNYYNVNNLYYNGILKGAKLSYYYDVNKKLYNYTDKSCNFIVVKGDHINYRYENKYTLGTGAFGSVVLCYDHKLNENKAIKIIKKNPNYYNVIKNEINILEFIVKKRKEIKNDWVKDIIINYYGKFIFRKHNMLIFDYYGSNLYDCIKYGKFNGFNVKICSEIANDICLGLQFLHNNGIIHRDLKPENLVFHKKRVIIIDFGLSIFADKKINTDDNFYIQSRYYRSPEVIFKIEKSYSIDIWSLGAILYEIYVGKPLFLGMNNRDMIIYFVSVIGPPPINYIKKYKLDNMFNINTGKLHCNTLSNKKTIYEKTRGFKYKVKYPKNIIDDEKMFNSFKDFCLICMNWEINKRPNINKLMNHSLFKKHLGLKRCKSV